MDRIFNGKQRFGAAVLGLLLPTAALAGPVALMPQPRSVAPGVGGALSVAGPFAVRWTDCGGTPTLDRAAARLRDDVQRQTGLVLDPARAVPVRVTCRSTGAAADAGEGYRLTVATDGIAIDADGPTGGLRALATLRQLVGLSPAGIAIPLQTIEDGPRFSWRGVMIDTVRHFVTPATIRRQIDAMERVKLNTLHLHLSDDQGFRVESRRYPRLNAAGPFFTQAEIRDLVSYAADRGVRIVPEFDVPGHTTAIVKAYPEVGVVAKAKSFGQPQVALNPAAPATYRFLERLFGEMAPLFPDPHFHVGGDEVGAQVWDDAADVKALMAREKLADRKAVEGYFARRVAGIVRGLGKTMIGWEEVAAAGVPQDVVVQAWQTSNAMAAATAAGHRTIASAGYYLNLLRPADSMYAIDPAATAAAGLAPDYAAALKKTNPLLAGFITDALVDFPHAPLTAAQEKLLIGGEAPLWGEIASDELVDHHMWPRAAVLAERFWSRRDVTDPRDMYRRLAIVSDQLSATGLDDRATQARMAMRIAPDDDGAVAMLLSLTGPVRNMAHDHRIRAMLAGRTIVQSLNALADAAPVDSLTARRFADDAARYVAGERALAPSLAARLTAWRDNDARFARAAGAIRCWRRRCRPRRRSRRWRGRVPMRWRRSRRAGRCRRNGSRRRRRCSIRWRRRRRHRGGRSTPSSTHSPPPT
ncbi:beta-N-acetylhexosaminidase [Sphingomonas hankookensis]|uniref:beta-N-acetylhexosaminidase n=1 Tax=Sphingomonas hankookensis TaxID=563996 RepID=UPI003F7933BF